MYKHTLLSHYLIISLDVNGSSLFFFFSLCIHLLFVESKRNIFKIFLSPSQSSYQTFHVCTRRQYLMHKFLMQPRLRGIFRKISLVWVKSHSSYHPAGVVLCVYIGIQCLPIIVRKLLIQDISLRAKFAWAFVFAALGLEVRFKISGSRPLNTFFRHSSTRVSTIARNRCAANTLRSLWCSLSLSYFPHFIRCTRMHYIFINEIIVYNLLI